jgi:predicted DNA-binding transcriptional regulator AlpA
MIPTPDITTPSPAIEPLLDEDETAVVCKCSVSTLQKQRLRGDGPPFVRLGRMIRYRRSSLLAYIAAREVTSTSQRLPAA